MSTLVTIVQSANSQSWIQGDLVAYCKEDTTDVAMPSLGYRIFFFALKASLGHRSLNFAQKYYQSTKND